jgi:hypothetical protein
MQDAGGADMQKRMLKLNNDLARSAACRYINDAPDGYVVTIAEPTRSLDANARLHAILTDIAREAKYNNQRRGVEFWKGLFVSGWQIATGQKPEIVPGLEGEFVNVRESTTTLTPRRIAELMEYIEAWAAMNGIKLTGEKDDD